MIKQIKSFIEEMQGYDDVDFLVMCKLDNGDIKFYKPVAE